MKAILTKGLQNSGKSTWAKQFVKDNQDWKRISRDDFREMLSSYTFNDANEKLVTKMVQSAIDVCIKSEMNFILDEMNLSEKTLNRNKNYILERAIEFFDTSVEIEIKEFPITLGEAIARHPKDKPFDVSVVKQTWKRYEKELKEMLDKTKVKIAYDSNLPDCVIFDIDGTLAHNKNRNIFDEDKVDTDEVIEATKFLNTLCESFGYVQDLKIIFMSGRHDSCREKTEKWLKDNYVTFDALYMRKAKDDRKDTIIKKELYEEHIKGKYNVRFVVDDRPQVLATWVELGLFTLNVNQDPLCLNNF